MVLKNRALRWKLGVTRARPINFSARLNPVTPDALYLWGKLTRGVDEADELSKTRQRYLSISLGDIL